jgi:hypothetical protein
MPRAKMKMKKRKPAPGGPRRKNPNKWRPIFVLKAYLLAKAGMPERDIHASLGVGHQSWNNWKHKLPELREALGMAQEARGEVDTLADYCFAQLPRDLQEVWRELTKAEEGGGVAILEQILMDHGRATRQRLYLHALVESDFNPSRAMSRMRVTRTELRDWLNTDPAFAELVEEMQEHKKNFFEESLVRLAAAGETAAVIFANKTLNKDRGYAVSADLNVKHSGQIQHNVLDLAELMPYLGQDTRLAVLEGLRQLQAKGGLQRLPDPEKMLSEQIACAAGAGAGSPVGSPASEGGFVDDDADDRLLREERRRRAPESGPDAQAL